MLVVNLKPNEEGSILITSKIKSCFVFPLIEHVLVMGHQEALQIFWPQMAYR